MNNVQVKQGSVIEMSNNIITFKRILEESNKFNNTRSWSDRL